MNFRRFIIFICSAVFYASVVCAQSSGDKLYNQGLVLQKTMTIASQNNAISKFTSAKKLYDSAAKKAQCEQAISVSRNIIASLKTGSKKDTSKKLGLQEYEEHKVEEPTLSITNSSFNVDLDSRMLNVGVNSNQKDWSVSTAPCEDGTSFLSVSKNGDSSISITVPENSSYMTRSQRIMIRAGNLSKDILVTQTGRRVDLDITEKILTFRMKGGSRKMVVTCNSDQEYPDNYYQNWYVESKPKWIQIVRDEKKKEKGKVREIGGKISGIFKGSEKTADPNMVKSNIILSCDAQIPGSVDAHNGRRGEVIIRSGDKTVSIFVTQEGKLTINQ